MTWSSRGCWRCAGLVALSAGPASGQQPVVELEPQVVVASPFRGPLDLALNPARAPLALSEVSAEQMRRQNAATLRDVVKNSAGVTVGTGNGVHDFFVVRGVDSLNGSVVLLDGIAEPESTFYPLHHLSSVQVLKGPGSFAYGGNALAGAVNLVRHQPGPNVQPALRLGAGSHEAFLAEGVLGSWTERPDIGTRVDAMHRQGDSHRDSIDYELSSINLSAVWFPSPGDTVRIIVDGMESDVVPDAGVPTLGNRLYSDSRSVTFQEPGDFSDQTLGRVVLQWERELDRGAQLRNRAYYTQFDWDSRGIVYAGFVQAGLGLEAIPVTLSRFRPRLDDEQRILGDEIELRWSGETGGVGHEALAGLEVQRLTDEFVLEIPPALDVNVLTGQQTPGILPPLPTETADATTDILSVYALDQATIATHWSILAGARADWMEFEDDAQGTSRSDTEFSPFAGVVLDVSEPLSFYANVGRGFNPPSTRTSGPRGEPETSQQVEGGAKWDAPDAGWTGLLSVYRLDRDNVAIPDGTGITQTVGEQSSRGVEVELEGPVAERVRARLTYGYLESDLDRFSEQLGVNLVDRSGNTAPFAPEHVGDVWLAWLPRDPWMLGLGVRAVGEQFIAADNVFTIDAYATLDAHLGYEQDYWSATLHVKNITDEDVLGRGQGSVSVIPEDGVSVFGVVGVKL